MRRAAGGWVGLYWRAGVSCSSAWQFISQLHLLGQPLFMPVSLSATPLGELFGERHFLWALPGTQGKGQPFLCRAQNNRSIGCPSHVMVSLVSSFCWIVQALLSTVSVDARGANMRRISAVRPPCTIPVVAGLSFLGGDQVSEHYVLNGSWGDGSVDKMLVGKA